VSIEVLGLKVVPEHQLFRVGVYVKLLLDIRLGQ